MKKIKRSLVYSGICLLLLAGGIIVTVTYLNGKERAIPLVYSDNQMLLELWNDYKKNLIEEEPNRTLDKQQQNITTSEGQSYTMLRAVWMDDKTTFDQSWRWTKTNLQRTDSLFAWKYGKLSNGSYGIQTEVGGNNTASDADVDIALALLLAFARWDENSYLAEAQKIIPSIWKHEVVLIQNKPVLMANNLEKNNQTQVIVNPSYFAPYAYKLFAKIDKDPAHDWQGLADNSYILTQAFSKAPLDKASSSGLPPNWIVMNRSTGTFAAHTSPDLTTNFGYDALRTPWRFALDWQWFKDKRAKDTLAGFNFLSDAWVRDGKLAAEYAHDGNVVGNYETPAMYGGAIGYFMVMRPEQGKQLYREKLQTLYSPDYQKWKSPLSYYDDNWAWFGIALSQGALVNITESL